MDQGWIKSYRSTMEKGWYQKSEYFHLWHHLLYKASHKGNEWNYKNETFMVNPGQLITSRKSLSEETGIQESKVERILKCFISDQQIEQQNLYSKRLITIANWLSYQKVEQQTEQPVNSKRTASEQPVNTIKKEKNGRSKYIEVDARFGDEFTEAFSDFKNMRVRMKKPMTEKAIDRMLKKMSKMEDDPIQVLIKSVDKGWTDVYPLKDDRKKRVSLDELKDDVGINPLTGKPNPYGIG